MDPGQTKWIERLLLRERERSRRALGQLCAQAWSVREGGTEPRSRYPLHPADGEVGAAGLEQAASLASREELYAEQVEEAIARLHQSPETFGRCRSCGGEIPFARLEALPHTPYCLSCRLREEGLAREP